MHIKPEEYFKNLLLTTTQVTAPLQLLAAKRLEIIDAMIKYIESQPRDLAQLEMLQQYNSFAKKDQELRDVVRGRIDSRFGPS